MIVRFATLLRNVASLIGMKSEYTVVARRYRPQQLRDLIGQEHVANALTNALVSGRVAHAYLFTGARGTGKTSTARILAKCLNCEKGPTPTPCDQCEICKGIMSGDDVDVLEIDGASNNKVEEVRDLRQNVGFRPTRARYKIYIIDEVHMLSPGAFNALLKTLEEPPAHVKFILATTETHKIPVTILSRCQRFDFANVRAAKIFEALKNIVRHEKLQADDDALHILAQRAGGSMRDSQSLLDQMLAFAEGTLTAEKVHALLGTAGDERIAELADLILRKDAKGALEAVQAFAERGLQIGELLDQIIDYWRGLMLILAAGPSYADLPGSPTFQDKLKAHAAGTNLDTVLAGLDVLTTAKTRSRGSLHVGTLLEMAIVRLALLEDMVSVAGLLSGVPATSAKPTVLLADTSKKNSLTAPAAADILSSPAILSSEPQQLSDYLKAELGPMKGASLDKAGIPAILGPNALAFRFANGYSSAYESCRDDRSIGLMTAALRKRTGQDWRVIVELLDAPAASTGTEVKSPPPPSGVSRNQELMSLPLFKKAADVLGAQLVKLDDGFSPVTVAASDDAEE